MLQDKNAPQLQDRNALSSEDKTSFSVEDRASSLTPEDRKILRERVERVLSGPTNESQAQVKDFFTLLVCFEIYIYLNPCKIKFSL